MSRGPGPRRPDGGIDDGRLDQAVARARQAREERERGYREQSLKLHPWVCGRCGRGFSRENLHLLTVHHKDHNHDNNPPDGSNWENLCIYCHDNEHSRYIDHLAGAGGGTETKRDDGGHRHSPFAGLGKLLRDE